MDRPTPRVALGLALRGIADSAIDVSDGLLADMDHILKQSRVGAAVSVDLCPASPVLAAQPLDRRHLCQLAGGDDYELLFTAPARQRDAVLAAATASGTPVTRIGQIESRPGLRLTDATGRVVDNVYAGFDHFRAD
jgi:thiamine-monophosphate kinase